MEINYFIRKKYKKFFKKVFTTDNNYYIIKTVKKIKTKDKKKS